MSVTLINNNVEGKEGYVPNKFNFGYLDPSKNKKPTISTDILRFGESSEAIDQSVVKNKRIMYVLEGSEETRLTNESNLHDKVSSFYNSNIKVIEIDSDNKESEKEGEQQKQKQKKMFRYFTSIDDTTQAVKCRRCGEYGHYQRSCTQKTRLSCNHCLGKHYSRQCTQITCMKCNQQGHMIKDCQSSSKKCYKCNKFGHRQANCGSLILYEDLKNSDFQSKDLQRMRCLSCQKKGHINCHVHNQRDNLYQIQQIDEIFQKARTKQLRRDEKRRKRQRMFEESTVFQFEQYERKQKDRKREQNIEHSNHKDKRSYNDKSRQRTRDYAHQRHNKRDYQHQKHDRRDYQYQNHGRRDYEHQRHDKRDYGYQNHNRIEYGGHQKYGRIEYGQERYDRRDLKKGNPRKTSYGFDQRKGHNNFGSDKKRRTTIVIEA